MEAHDETPSSRRARARRRRLAFVAAAALAVVAAALGISFTADTAVNQATASPLTTAKLVYTPADTLPTGFAFRVSTITNGDPTVATPATLTPVAGAAGTVTSKGDIALVDARSSSTGNQGHERITVYLANLKQLQAVYSQFTFPIRVYEGTFNHQPSSDGTNWNAGADLLAASANTYLTNTVPFVSFTVPTEANDTLGNVLAIQLAADGDTFPGSTTSDGGSFYTVCTNTATTCTGGSLNPQFYISVDTLP